MPDGQHGGFLRPAGHDTRLAWAGVQAWLRPAPKAATRSRVPAWGPAIKPPRSRAGVGPARRTLRFRSGFRSVRQLRQVARAEETHQPSAAFAAALAEIVPGPGNGKFGQSPGGKSPRPACGPTARATTSHAPRPGSGQGRAGRGCGRSPSGLRTVSEMPCSVWTICAALARYRPFIGSMNRCLVPRPQRPPTSAACGAPRRPEPHRAPGPDRAWQCAPRPQHCARARVERPCNGRDWAGSSQDDLAWRRRRSWRIKRCTST